MLPSKPPWVSLYHCSPGATAANWLAWRGTWHLLPVWWEFMTLIYFRWCCSLYMHSKEFLFTAQSQQQPVLCLQESNWPRLPTQQTVYFQQTTGSCWNMKLTRICGSRQFLLIFFFASLMLHAISPASLVYTRIPLSCLSVWYQVAINLNPQGTAKLKVPAIAPLACFRQHLPSRWPV